MHTRQDIKRRGAGGGGLFGQKMASDGRILHEGHASTTLAAMRVPGAVADRLPAHDVDAYSPTTPGEGGGSLFFRNPASPDPQAAAHRRRRRRYVTRTLLALRCCWRCCCY